MSAVQFRKSQLMQRVTAGPVKLLELAHGSKNHNVRKRLMRQIHALVDAGAIKRVWMQGFPHYVLSDYQVSDDQRVRMLLDNCRRVDDCMVWTGHVDASRGPIGRADDKPLTVRRFIWDVKRSPLSANQAVRMRETCEHGCVEYRHMHIAPRNESAIGRRVSPAHRQAMTLAVRARLAKLNWAKVREIRASEESNKVLAERMGVTASLIGQVRRHEIWVEHGGLFTGLMGRAAA